MSSLPCSFVQKRASDRFEARQRMKFEIIGEVRSVETIASGREIRVLPTLRKKWGAGRWRKMKGLAHVRILRTGNILRAEIHWYEAHGIGKRDIKISHLRGVVERTQRSGVVIPQSQPTAGSTVRAERRRA
jgi:hypothetical protein